MEYEFFTTNDDTKIAYQTSQPLLSPHNDTAQSTDNHNNDASKTHPETCILLIHGFSGSSSYFTRNTPTLSNHHHLTIALDLRGHGQSQHTKHGYHVARLAQDLHDFITKIQRQRQQSKLSPLRIYAVGSSLGAAVLWTYTELFTDRAFAGLVFVDQAPLQDRSTVVEGDNWDATLAHSGCYDEETTHAAQRAWTSPDPDVRDRTHRDLVASCLGYRCQPLPSDDVSADQERDDEKFFTKISVSCDGPWLARLLADHTRYDHRDSIEGIEKPVMVMMGRRSGCFSIDGMMETVRRADLNPRRRVRAEARVFESGHWLFWEEAARFNEEVLGFVDRCEKLYREDTRGNEGGEGGDS